MIGENIRVLVPEILREGNNGYFAGRQTTGEAGLIGFDREVIGRRKDGTTFPLEITMTEFQLKGKGHYTSVVRDITARKHLEEQFHQAQKMEAFGQLVKIGGLIQPGTEESLGRNLPSLVKSL